MDGVNYNLGITITANETGVDKALQSVMDSFEIVEKSIKSSTANINSSLNSTTNAMNKYSQQFNNLDTKMKGMQSTQTKQTQQIEKAEQSTKKQTKAMETKKKQIDKNTKATKENMGATDNWLSSQSRSLAIAIKSTVVWGAATTAIYGTQKAFREVHQTMMEVNSEMIALERVMTGATTDFVQLRNTAGDLGVEYAGNIQDVISSMVEWGRQGRNQVEVIELTEAALLATNVAEMEAKESVDLLTASLLQFNMDASEAVEIIDRWNEVANNFAVTATDLAVAVRESGSAAQSAGISMDSLIGMTTALSAATAKSGSRIGRALRTVFSRIMGDAGATAESLGKVEVALNSVGIALREDENTYRNLTDVLTDLSVKWGDLDEVMQANIARAIGGRRRYSDVIALIENWDMALDATSSSMDSLNSALEENETYMGGLEANWKQVRAEFDQIINTFTNFGSEVLSVKVAEGLSSALRGLNNFIRGVKETENMIKALSTAILGAGGAYIAITKFNAGLAATKWLLGYQSGISLLNSGFVGLLSSINPAIVAIGALTFGVTKYIAKQGELNASLEKAKNDRKSLNKIIEESNQLTSTEIKNSQELVDKYSDLVDKYEELEESMVSDDSGSYTSSILGNIEGGVLGEQTELVNDLKVVFEDLVVEGQSVEEFIEAVNEHLKLLNSTLENSVSGISDYTIDLIENTRQEIRQAKALEGKINTYEKLANQSDKTFAQEKEMEQLQRDLLEQYPKLATMSGSFGSRLAELGNQIIPKFTANSDNLNSVIDVLESKMSTLKIANDELGQQYEMVTDKLFKAEERFRNLTDEQLENDTLVQEILKNITFYTKKQETLDEQLQKGVKTQEEINKAIEDFSKGLDSIDVETFITSFVGALDILEDFNEKAKEINTQVEDMDMRLQNSLEFENWLSGLLGEDPITKAERTLGVYKDYQDEVIGLAEELSNLNPGDLTTYEELVGYLETETGMSVEELPFDISEVFDAWNEEGFEIAQATGKELAGIFIMAMQENIEALETDLSFVDLFSEVLDVGDLSSATDEQLERINEIFAKYRAGDNVMGTLKQYFPDNYKEISQMMEHANDVLTFREKELTQRQRIAKEIERINALNEREAEIASSLSEMRSESLSEYAEDLATVREDLKLLDTWQEEVYDQELINNINETRKALEKEEEVLEVLTQLTSGNFDLSIIEDFNDFDISEITSMEEAENKIDSMTKRLKDFRNVLLDMGLSKNQIDTALNMLGLDEETIDEVFELLDTKIKNLEHSWYSAMSNAISNAVGQFTDDMDFGDKLEIMVREGFSSAFSELGEDEVKSKLTKFGSNIGEMLNLGDGFGEAFGQFSTQAGKVMASGGSMGQSFVTGIASVISGSPVIGQAIGSITQMLAGGVEGREDMEEAKKINKQVKEASESLKEFGITADTEFASYEDTASSLEGFFGGEDWDVKGLEKAERSLEDMNEQLNELSATSSGIMSSMVSALNQNLNYEEFKSTFDETIGSAMKDTLIDSLMDTYLIEEQIKKIVGKFTKALSDGSLSGEERSDIQDLIDQSRQELSELNEVVNDFDWGGLGGVEPDVTMDRTFRAGSTSSITYNNTFTVQSQIFLGDEASARNAAKKLYPYIKEQIDRRT